MNQAGRGRDQICHMPSFVTTCVSQEDVVLFKPFQDEEIDSAIAEVSALIPQR